MRRSIAIALAVSAAASASVATSPAEAKTKPSPYVAMGDSYASGAGVLPLDPSADPRCSQSALNFGHVIARATGSSDFTDVSCGGAQTKDFAQPQHPGVAPQLDALTKDTRLVTMTIGGNDGNVFAESILACGTAAATDPVGNPCERSNGNKFEQRITHETYPSLVRTLKQVRQAAPRAKVAILGYPRILPEKGSAACTATMLVAQGDVPYLNGVQKTLNDAVRRAAGRTGVKFVDMWAPSSGRDACQAPDKRWIEPVVPMNAAPVHPNARGEQAMADQTIKAMRLPTG